MADEALVIPVPGDGANPLESAPMADAVIGLPADDYGHWKNDMFGQRAQARGGETFLMESLRFNYMEGKVGFREALAVRTTGQPGVAQNTDTSPGMNK